MPGIDSSTKLLAQMNGSGATFVDSSPSAKTITANGNATQVTRKFNGTAGWFDGSADTNYLFVADSSDWTFGTGNYTIESFVLFSGTIGNHVVIENISDGTNYARLDYAGGQWRYQVIESNSPLYTALTYTHSPNKNQWYHIAIVRNGTDQRMYLDGVSVASTTASFTYPNYTYGLNIGGTTINSGYGHTGWLKELRISDTARYTTGFTPTTSQFTSDSNTKLLLHFDNASATSPLAPAIKLDGTGDFLSVGDSSDWDFSTGDFTAEFWVRYNSIATDQNYIDIGSFSAGVMIQQNNASGLNVYVQNVDKGYFGAFIPVANRWYHIAVSRSGTSLRLFVDGKQNGSTATSSENIAVTQGVTIGARQATTNPINGWMREIRISNTARYTADFTPSQTGFTVDSNTKLYIKGNESNGVTTFVDSETTPKTVTTNGDAVINYIEDYRATIFKDDGNTGHKPYAPTSSLAKVDFLAPFGSGSCALDGTGDFLSVGDSADWDFGTGAFCLETYARWSTVGLSCLVEVGSAGVVGEKMIYDAGTLTAVVNNASVIGPAFTPIAHNWYHIAMTRSGSTLYLFANGTLLSSGANSSDVSGSSAGVRIGSDQLNQPITGFLDNARISNVARYTATFDPPTEFKNNTGFITLFLDM